MNSLADKPVGRPLQCATHTIWGAFAMAGFEVVPGSSCKPLPENFSTKEVKITTLLVLCAGAYAKKMDGCHIRESLSDFPQDGLQVLPYGRWSLRSGCRYSAKGGRGRCPPHIVNPSVQSGLLV